ncbi:unnamed protein product [Symbiodinium necroappetens]|uniref:Uncharacterized protein n=1 Tax=Symbiodinium necroappetens TaxID=1628268 RepID=A0A812JS48_9DINO|nr:unnamed protein product [Symbiodinium necroappetens]
MGRSWRRGLGSSIAAMAFALSLHGVPVATSLPPGFWTKKSNRKDQEGSRSVLTAATFAAAAAAHAGWCWTSTACGSRAAPRFRLRMHAVEIVDAEIISEMPASGGDGQDAPQADPAEAEAAAAVIDAVLQLVEAWLNQRMTCAGAEKSGVPVRNQVMEYKAEPSRSPLATCGIPELAPGGTKATQLLVAGLRAKGADADKAEVAAAVLCLMLGGLDEAHNLVMPHCWATPTTFGGPPKLGSTVFREAAYGQVIVHRMEGENLGEFGSGNLSCRYWLGQAFSLGASQHTIFAELRKDAEGFVGTCHDSRCLLRTMGPKWEPSLFNKLCEDVLLTEDPDTLEFCKAVQTRELQLLFEHIMAPDDSAAA